MIGQLRVRDHRENENVLFVPAAMVAAPRSTRPAPSVSCTVKRPGPVNGSAVGTAAELTPRDSGGVTVTRGAAGAAGPAGAAGAALAGATFAGCALAGTALGAAARPPWGGPAVIPPAPSRHARAVGAGR